MKLTNGEMVGVLQGLQRLRPLNSTKVSYALMKNKRTLTSMIKELASKQQPSEKVKKFDELRIGLCVKHSKKDDKGNPVIQNNNYVIDNGELFDKELKELQETEKELFEAHKEFNDSNQKMMFEEVEIQLHMVHFNDLLPLNLNERELEIITPMTIFPEDVKSENVVQLKRENKGEQPNDVS